MSQADSSEETTTGESAALPLKHKNAQESEVQLYTYRI